MQVPDDDKDDMYVDYKNLPSMVMGIYKDEDNDDDMDDVYMDYKKLHKQQLL